MSPTPARRSRARRLPRLAASVLALALAASGGALLLDAAAYAATGSSLLLGRLNSADAPTVVRTTAAGPALRLLTATTAAPPFTTNATGRVAHLDADKVDGLDAAAIVGRARTDVDATRLGGRTPAELVASVPVPRFEMVRTSSAQTANPGYSPGVLSGPGATPGTYVVRGTVTIPCGSGGPGGFVLDVLRVQSATDMAPIVGGQVVPASSCGSPLPVSARIAMTSTSRLLVRVLDVDAGQLVAAPLSIRLEGVPATSRL
jgi:hypothetical protein